MPPAANVQLRMQDAGWSADVERWESDEDSDQSEEERDRDVDAAEGLQLSEMAVVRLRLCIRIHWIHCVSGPCKNTQKNTPRRTRSERAAAPRTARPAAAGL